MWVEEACSYVSGITIVGQPADRAGISDRRRAPRQRRDILTGSRFSVDRAGALMTTSLALPMAAPPEPAEPRPIMDWHVVPAKSRIRFAAGRFLGTRGTLRDVRGVVRLIEGQPRYTHVEVRVPAAAVGIMARRRLRLDADLHPFVAFFGWRIRGNPRRSFALDGELQVGEVRRQVVASVVTTDYRFDDATETEEATFRARLSLGPWIRVFVEMTLARQVSRR
jgi:polyisoprenoid-binding protein YceI